MILRNKWFFPLAGALLSVILGLQQVQAAVSLDRTRIVFNGDEQSVSLNINNTNLQLPYMTQAWVEDEQGKKITTPLTVQPPSQKLDPGAKSQIKVQALPVTSLLPQDRETLFYFNLLEIPPETKKPHTLQLALQTRIKLFYRPKALSHRENTAPWQEQLTLTKQGEKYQLNNPTPYYITIVNAGSKLGNKVVEGFELLMLAPKSTAMLNVGVGVLGNAPVLTYVNDYGNNPQLQFNCSGVECKVKPARQDL